MIDRDSGKGKLFFKGAGSMRTQNKEIHLQSGYLESALCKGVFKLRAESRAAVVGLLTVVRKCISEDEREGLEVRKPLVTVWNGTVLTGAD